MRILYCNKYNFAFSGTEVYLFEVMELMRTHGPRGRVVFHDGRARRGHEI